MVKKKSKGKATKAAKVSAKKLQHQIDHLLKHRMFQDRLFMLFLVLAGLACIGTIATLIFQVRPKDFVVPLQYSTLQGFDALGGWYRLYIYAVFALLVSIGNTVLASMIYDKSRIASFFLVVGTFMVNALTLVVVITLTSHINL